MSTICTRALSLLPDIHRLRSLSQSLALLDAILSPVWEYRYYSFDSHWDDQENLASMRNGSGDTYIAWFSPAGVVLKGFAHESPMSPYRTNPPQIWPGVLDDIPSQFSGFLSQPAFILEETTFCIWQSSDGDRWQSGSIQFPVGPDPDGSARLLKMLDGKPETYQKWAESYYEKPIFLSAVVHIYEHRRLTDAVIMALNPAMSVHALIGDLNEIDYR
jgi:hypothetical protein